MSNDLTRLIDQLVARGFSRDGENVIAPCWYIFSSGLDADWEDRTPSEKELEQGDYWLVINPGRYFLFIPIYPRGRLGTAEVKVYDGQVHMGDGFAGAVEAIKLDNLLSQSRRLYLEWELKQLEPEPSLEELEQQLAQRLSQREAVHG